MEPNAREGPHWMTSIKNIARSFRYRNYRLCFGGQLISVIGVWMQMLAMSWLVYRLTNSAWILGVVSFFGQVPFLLVAPFAGVIVDRLDRRSILLTTQVLSMIQALTIAILVIIGKIEIWHIIVLGFFQGIVNAFDAPSRQAFVVQMVEDKSDLGNAIALNSTMWNGARLIGPSVAGLIIKIAGEGVCFLLNGLSYIAVIMALLAMKIQPHHNNNKKNS